jgi:hypothetical protein
MSSMSSRRTPTPAARSNRSRRSLEQRFLIDLAETGTAAVRARKGSGFSIPGRRASISDALARDLLSRDLVTLSGDALEISEAGRKWVARAKAGGDPHRAQHGDVTAAEEIAPGGRMEQAESPLLWLHRRKDSSGQPLIGAAMFAAGTFGNLAPKITASWDATARCGTSFGAHDPSDGVLAARQRVRRAVEWVGPELSGVLLDVCCFLKGLEEVERERRWPARSAKIILALALGKLARHYGYSDSAEGVARRRTG